jgi:non-ribosomal peptide synthetase component F
MRIRVQRNCMFSELLKQVRAIALDAYEHQDVPFDRIVQEIAPQRRSDRNPMFQVTFAVQNAPWDSQVLRDLQVELIDRNDVLVRFDMELHCACPLG